MFHVDPMAAPGIVTYTWMQIGSILFLVMKNNSICLLINKVLGNITPSSFFFGRILTSDLACVAGGIV